LKFYRFYSSIEPELSKMDWGSVNHNFSERLKTPKLEHDLTQLGAIDEAKEAPSWTSLPELDSLAKAYGSLYVLEGATLGGQIIKRHLKTHLGLDTENGGEFFTGYGENTGRMWKEFGANVTEFAENNDVDDVIVNSAKATFDSFRECFSDSSKNRQKTSSVV